MIPHGYYLGHPFASRKIIRQWELIFEERTGIPLLNPFYDVFRPDVEDIDKNISNPRIKDPVQLVNDDLQGLRSQQGLLCVINEHIAVGTLQEMVYGHIYGKVVHSVVTRKDLRRHQWLMYHSSFVFDSLEEFEQFVLSNI